MLLRVTGLRLSVLTKSRLDKQTWWCLYGSLPCFRQVTLLRLLKPCLTAKSKMCRCKQRQYSTSRHSRAGWRRNFPTSLEAVAGLAKQAQHEITQQQRPEPANTVTALAPATGTPGQEQTGAFARLPMVPVSSELIESALKRANKVAGSKKLKNEAQKARSK